MTADTMKILSNMVECVFSEYEGKLGGIGESYKITSTMRGAGSQEYEPKESTRTPFEVTTNRGSFEMIIEEGLEELAPMRFLDAMTDLAFYRHDMPAEFSTEERMALMSKTVECMDKVTAR